MPHIVLLGDSVFDNQVYVPGGRGRRLALISVPTDTNEELSHGMLPVLINIPRAKLLAPSVITSAITLDLTKV